MWCGLVWCGVLWCGMMWCGVVWCSTGLRVDINTPKLVSDINFMSRVAFFPHE